LLKEIQENPVSQVKVDLEKQVITLLTTGASEKFDINSYKKKCLLNGYDDIDYLLSIGDKIKDYEKLKNH